MAAGEENSITTARLEPAPLEASWIEAGAPRARVGDRTAHSDPIPVTFGGQWGALHPAAPSSARGIAVILCPPVGRDAHCVYRPLFLWAQALAAQGFDVLRYDHLGEGDSADIDPHVDQWSLWLEGVNQAAQFARRHTGANTLVLAGLRIGATLALAAAPKVLPDAVLALAPLPNGEAWLRELRLSAALEQAPAASAGGLQARGLHLSAATVQALQAVDLQTVPVAWRSAFVATNLTALYLGEDVTRTPFHGLGRFLKDPHLSETPARVFERATDWLKAFRLGGVSLPAAPPPPAQLVFAHWVERPCRFGPGLRGVLCEPRTGGGAEAVVISNTAADPRAGIGNFATRAARALASAGVATLRFDFAGIGESDAPPGPPMHIYLTPRLDEFRAAAEFLEQHGYRRLTLAGICTGGFHAVRAVTQDRRFLKALAVNARLVWRPWWPLDVPSRLTDGDEGQPSLRRGRWARLVRGQVDVRRAANRRLRQVWSSYFPDAAARVARREIQQASLAGAQLRLIFGQGDFTLGGEQDFGPRRRWLRSQRGVTVRVLRRVDHALLCPESQSRVLKEIFEFLGLDRSSAEIRLDETSVTASVRSGRFLDGDVPPSHLRPAESAASRRFSRWADS